MVFMYLFILYLLLSISNIYVIWLMMEMMFLYFLILVMTYENKSVGLVIYFFFQSVMSLLLFMSILNSWGKTNFLLLIAKLGMFPFFYWMVVVSVKVGVWGNLFVLGMQKISIFWLLWLMIEVSFSLIYYFVYLSVFFVVVSLLNVTDLWLLLVYSSISNSGMLVLGVYGSHYIWAVFLYLFVIMSIIYIMKSSVNYNELLLVVFFFLVIPPFILFFMKFYIVMSLDFMMKMGFMIFIFDVFVLLYYFSLIFMKFMLMEIGIIIYLMNLFLLLLMLGFSNCVAMIIFYKS